MEQIRIRYTVAVLPPRPAAALTASTFESVIYDLLAEEHIAGAAEGNEWGVVPGGLTVEEIADEGPTGPHAPSIRRITVCHEMADRSPGDRRSFAARAEGFRDDRLVTGMVGLRGSLVHRGDHRRACPRTVDPPPTTYRHRLIGRCRSCARRAFLPA